MLNHLQRKPGDFLEALLLARREPVMVFSRQITRSGSPFNEPEPASLMVFTAWAWAEPQTIRLATKMLTSARFMGVPLWIPELSQTRAALERLVHVFCVILRLDAGAPLCEKAP